jgi:hypothetical protein
MTPGPSSRRHRRRTRALQDEERITEIAFDEYLADPEVVLG